MIGSAGFSLGGGSSTLLPSASHTIQAGLDDFEVVLHGCSRSGDGVGGLSCLFCGWEWELMSVGGVGFFGPLTHLMVRVALEGDLGIDI